MADFRYVVADVFTDRPLTGNQLAVFTDAREIPAALLQPLAREVGFSETVFVYPPEAGGHVRTRIFTPAQELPFAGHPVLGTAFVLGGPMQLGVIALETGSGLVPVELTRDDAGRIVFGRMEQPIPAWAPFARSEELAAALGVEGAELPVEVSDAGVRHAYVALPSGAAVASLRPDHRRLAELAAGLGVYCFAPADGGWKARMFGSGLGITEDPATGSAAGPLAVHLARHGRIPFGEEIAIRQGEEMGRPSVLHARVDGSAERVERVEVGGSAVVVARGAYRL